MGEAPPAFSLALAHRRGAGGAAPHCFRMPRRRKVFVVRLGSGGARTGGGRRLCLRRLRLRWLRLAVLCAAALSGPLGAAAPDAASPSPWKGGAVDPYAFAAPFVPAMLLKRPGNTTPSKYT